MKNSFLNYIFFLFLGMLFSCQETSPTFEVTANTDEFILPEDLEISLIAQAPMITNPVAIAEDAKGRIWVVEMNGYMRDLDGSEEDLPDGRIVILDDINDDGQMDTQKIFLDKLVNPRALSFVYDGILFTDGTNLKFAKIKKDKPIEIEIVDDKYVVGGNIEHQPNGLYYNLDNWIYSAKSNARYQRQEGIWKKEITSFRGQWGISSDEMGRLVYNHNSAALIGDVTMPNVLLNNPYQKIKENSGNFYTDNMRIHPIQATSINRGYELNSLDSIGKVKSYTSACSPLFFHSDGLGKNYQNNAFVCAPEANLIASYNIDQVNQIAKQTPRKNFIISNDETFRPVGLNMSFDGSLLITDMRKGVIQHAAYMSSYLREKILSKGLDQIINKGRIYRVTRKDGAHKKPKLDEINTVDLPKLLLAPNMATRLFAQKELVFRDEIDEETLNQLQRIAAQPSLGPGCIHAWYILKAIGLVNSKLFNNLKVEEVTPAFCISLLPILQRNKIIDTENTETVYRQLYNKIRSMDNSIVDINLAATLGKHPNLWKELYTIYDKYPEDKRMVEAIVAGVYPRLEDFYKFAKKNSYSTLLTDQLSAAIKNKKEENQLAPKFQTVMADDNRTNGLKIFKKYCVACHGTDGLGLKNLAPTLSNSKILTGPKFGVVNTIFRGYDSGENNYNMKMPAYINDPKMTDKDIADLISYLFSTFAKRWDGVKMEEVRLMRDTVLMEI